MLQACDLLLVLGSRLNIRQTSYNWTEFAPHAKVVWVDIDPAEMSKPFVRPDVAIVADLADFVPALLGQADSVQMPPRESWWEWVRHVRRRYEPTTEDYASRDQGINPYHLVMELSDLLDGKPCSCLRGCHGLHRAVPGARRPARYAALQQQRVRIDGVRPPGCLGCLRGGARAPSGRSRRRWLPDDESSGAPDDGGLATRSPAADSRQRWLPIDQADTEQLLRSRVRSIALVRDLLSGLRPSGGVLRSSR